MRLLLSILMLGSMLFASNELFINDYNKALELAKAEKKDVYMLVTSNSCRWCRKFEDITLKDQEIIKKLQEQYILLALNRDVDTIPEQYKVKRVPKHFFLTDKGEIIFAFLGYWNPDDFASFMQDVEKKK